LNVNQVNYKLIIRKQNDGYSIIMKEGSGYNIKIGCIKSDKDEDRLSSDRRSSSDGDLNRY